MDEGGNGASPTQDIQQPQASEPKNALVPSVMPIKAITVAMMDAGGSQMRDPPHGHKQCQQQPIEPLTILNQAGFQVPATAFVILKGRLHTQT
jgi:hypothetical protein